MGISVKVEVAVPLKPGMCFYSANRRGRVIEVEDRRVKVSYHCSDKSEIEERWLESHNICIGTFRWFVNEDALKNEFLGGLRPEYDTPEEIDALIEMLMVVRSFPKPMPPQHFQPPKISPQQPSPKKAVK